MAGGQYPGDLDSFTANVDGVDDVLAADINELQVMGVATQTELGTDPAGSCTDLKTRLAHSINDAGMLEFDDCTELTISGGAVTVTQNYHKIDTQGDAPPQFEYRKHGDDKDNNTRMPSLFRE